MSERQQVHRIVCFALGVDDEDHENDEETAPFEYAINYLLAETKIGELQRLGNAILNDPTTYDDIQPYVQKRLAELKANSLKTKGKELL